MVGRERIFPDRAAAGRALADLVAGYLRDRGDSGPVLVLGLPRGGVPIAEQVARVIGAGLDVVVARKVGLPGHPEYGVGAVTPDGPAIFHHPVLARAGLSEDDMTEAVARERAEARRRLSLFRGGRPEPPVRGSTVIVVDDGLATGVTAMAALRDVRRREPAHLVYAAPVCASESAEALRAEADAVICAHVPPQFWAVGQFYEDFEQLTDGDVERVLARRDAGVPTESEIRIPANGDHVAATVGRPSHPHGIVLFAHGSGSSRHSPRNRMVAARLNEAGYLTILLDLLTPVEAEADERTGQWRFDIGLLSGRLVAVIDWLGQQADIAALPVGLFGASTGAAAALVAAAQRPDEVHAVVSRGGRPDLAGGALPKVAAATLLIVGGEDEIVIALNEDAAAVLGDLAKLVIIPGASHLFTEPGALERVADLAADWFDKHLSNTEARLISQ